MKFFELLVLGGMLAGCGDKASDDKKSAPENESPKEAAPADLSLTGSWQTPCLDAGDGDFERYAVTFTETEATIKYESGRSSDCSTFVFTKSGTRSFTIGEVSTAADGAWNVDYVVTSASLTLHTAEILEAANADHYYNIGDWKVDVERDITGRKIDSESEVEGLGAFFSIVKIEGDSLMVGDTDFGNGDTAELRPVKLDEELIFVRQPVD